MKTREELKAEVLEDLRKAKVKDQVTLQMKLRQIVRTRLAQPTQKELGYLENDINAKIKVIGYELDLIEEEMKGAK